MRPKNILLLAVIIYFATINIGLLCAQDAKEREKEASGDIIVTRDPFISIVDKDKIKYDADKKKPISEMPLFPMKLKGIMVQRGNSVAIINEKIVREGQILLDYEVKRIDKEGVILSYQGKEVRIVMQENVKAEWGAKKENMSKGKKMFPGKKFIVGASPRR